MKIRTIAEFSTRTLIDLLALAPSLLSSVIATDEQTWAFGAWRGKRYADNPRYLFEYVTKHRGDVRAIWLTGSPKVRTEIRTRFSQAFLWWEPAGIIAAFRSSVWFFTHEPSDVSPLGGRNAHLIDLTHGTPLKRIGLATRSGRVPAALDPIREFRRRHRPSATFICCASERARERYLLATDLPPDRVIATGYARWAVFDPARRGVGISTNLANRLQSANLVVLFAPTHRGFGETAYRYDQVPGFAALLNWAESHGWVILHRRHLAGHSQPIPSPAWIDLDLDDCPDINDMLPMIDRLVTDYSSIMYDYCVFEDGALFLAPDLHEYENLDQGLFVPYATEIPGAILRDWNQVLEHIKSRRFADPDKLETFRLQHGDHIAASPESAVLKVVESALRSQRETKTPGGW